MTKRNADYLIPANWLVPQDHSGPVAVIVTWWEPEMGIEALIYDDGPTARAAINSEWFNQRFMTELDDRWGIHDDVVVRVIPF